MADIRPVTTVFCNDSATFYWVISERAARISTEATPTRRLGPLLGDQRHRAIKADSKHFLRGIQIGIGFAMLNVRSEPADAGADRLAVLRMEADFPRQRQQCKCTLQIDIHGRGSFRQSGAARLFASARFAKLHIWAETPAA